MLHYGFRARLLAGETPMVVGKVWNLDLMFQSQERLPLPHGGNYSNINCFVILLKSLLQKRVRGGRH